MESLHNRFQAAGELLAGTPERFGSLVQFLEALADGDQAEQLRERFELAGNRLATDPECYEAVVDFVEAVAEGDGCPFSALVPDAFRLLWGSPVGVTG